MVECQVCTARSRRLHHVGGQLTQRAGKHFGVGRAEDVVGLEELMIIMTIAINNDDKEVVGLEEI